MKTSTILKTMALVLGLVFYAFNGFGQTTINFDDNAKWTAGSVALTSYALNHTYVDGSFSATGGPALRNGTAAQDGFPGAFGTYSWRLQNVNTVDWRITIATGGISTFSVKIRRWDGSPSPDYNLEYSIDGGSNWVFIALINNTSLGNSSDWTTFDGTINSENDNIIIRLKSNSAGERIMLDDFTWAEYTGGSPTVATPQFNPSSGSYYSTQFVEISTSTEGATIYYTTNGTDPDEESTIYTNPVEITENTTLKARAYKVGFDPSAIATGVYNFPAINNVANIAALRLGATDGTVYRLTGEAILKAKDAFNSRKFIEDGTAAIMIFDAAGIITGNYNLGDGMENITGTLTLSSSMLRFVPVLNVGPASSTGNPVVPTIFEIDALTSGDQAKLVKLENVTFTTTGTFATGQNYTITDGTNNLILRTDFFNADYIGTTIPTLAQNITGVIIQFNDALQIVPRFLADFENAVFDVEPPDFFSATTVSSSQITLNFSPNASGDDIVIVFNLTGTFSEPSGDPPAEGDPFAGGTLLYVGTDSPLNHNGLTPAETYYYRAWSFDKDYYSPGLNANATTYAVVPSNHVTGISATANSSSSITVAWTDSDASGYLIKGGDVDFNAITAPTDGVSVADGALVKNVAAGVGSHEFTGLTELTEYFFKIYPYNGSGATINYKTDGTVPEASATTEEAPPTPDIITQWNFNGTSTSEVPGGTSSPLPAVGSGVAALFGGTTASFASGVASGGSSDPVSTSPPNYGWNTETYPSQGAGNGTRGVQFNVSTIGYQDISLSFDLRTSNTASRWYQVLYTIDGENFVPLDEPFRLGGLEDNSVGDTWSNQLFADFSSVSGVDNNPDFAARVVSVFSPIAFTEYLSGNNYDANTAYEAARNRSSGTQSNYGGGTWRFDMVTFSGYAVDLDPPVKLVIADINGGNSPTINNEFNVTVQSQNTDNLPSGVTEDTEVTLTLATGSGTLGGTLTGTILSGQNSVTFTNITYNVAETGVSITATATDGMVLSPATSATFEVISPATQLAFVGFPANGTVNVTTASFTVEARRSNNTLDPNFAGTITLSKNSGTGNVSGTLAVAAINGVATFNDIVFDAAGEYTLAADATGLTQAISTIISISASPTIAGLMIPQFIAADNPTNNRIPYAFRAKLENLLPNSTYKYINQVVIAADGPTTAGAGNAIYVSESGTFFRATETSFTTVGKHSEFTTDAEGSYTGWFITEPTSNERFTPGNEVFMRIRINDGAGGTAAVHYLTINDGIDVLGFGTDADATKGTAVRGISAYEPKNFVFLYENEAGAGRPLYGSSIETTGIDFTLISNYAAFYKDEVSGVDGAWGAIIPNINANGVRRIEERSLADASLVDIHTSEDGMWGATNTVNPTGGTTALVIDLTIPEVPENRTVDGIILGMDDTECYDATNNITVTNTTIGNGASVEFRAGVSIIFGDGFVAAEGSYVLATITDVYCSLPLAMLASEEIIVPEMQNAISESATFKVYPNPSSGVFALELSGVESTEKVTVEIYGMMGERLLRSDLSGSQIYQFDLSTMPRGVYILRIMHGGQAETQKIIRQ